MTTVKHIFACIKFRKDDKIIELKKTVGKHEIKMQWNFCNTK